MGQAMGPLSVGMGAMTSMFGAVSESNALKSQASAYKENARLDVLQGALETDAIQKRGRAVQGEAIAALAGGGGDVSGMSARDLIFENNLQIGQAAMNARYGAAEEARGDMFKAAEARTAARAAIVKGIMGAGAAAITGISNQQSSSARYQAMFPGGQRLPMPPTGYSAPPTFGM